MTALWTIFITLQIVGAGSINAQQAAGMHEINPIYGRHPSKERVYLTKAAETLALYGLTRALPEYEAKLVGAAIAVQLAFFAYDDAKGISLRMEF